MKVQPMAAPQAAPTQASPAQSARQAAMAAFMGNQQAPQAAPAQQTEAVANPNNVSPEEMSAIIPKKDEELQLDGKQPDNIEATDEKPEDKTPEDPALSRQFAKLAQQEKALRAKAAQQEQAYKAREADLAAREAKLTQQPKQQFDQSKYVSIDDLKYNALSVLEKAGVSYEQLTNQLLNPVQTDPAMQAHIAKLEAKLAAIEEQTNTQKTSFEKQQEQAYKAAVKQIETDVTNLVNKDPSFEAIKHAGAYKDVVDLIEQTYHKDGYLMSVEEASQAVEDYLVDQYTTFSNIGKVKQKIAQANTGKAAQSNPEQKPGTESQSQQKQQPMKTLTNTNSSTRQLSARERALLAFKGEKV